MSEEAKDTASPEALLEKRLEAMRARQAARAKAEEEGEQLRALEASELEERLEGETKGKRDQAFAIVNNRFGVFGLRMPDTQAIRNWQSAPDAKKETLEWQIGILRHYILPTERAIPWAQLATERPGLCWQTASAFVDLMGIDRSLTEKKR